MSENPNLNDGIYDAKQLGVPKMLILGLQHTFAMFGATILVPVDKAPKFRGTGDRDANVNMLCIQDTEGNVLLPVFTSRKELGTMEGNEIIFSPVADVIETAYAADNVAGVIVNPFGQNFMMDQHTLEFLMARNSINEKDPE